MQEDGRRINDTKQRGSKEKRGRKDKKGEKGKNRNGRAKEANFFGRKKTRKGDVTISNVM